MLCDWYVSVLCFFSRKQGGAVENLREALSVRCVPSACPATHRAADHLRFLFAVLVARTATTSSLLAQIAAKVPRDPPMLLVAPSFPALPLW